MLKINYVCKGFVAFETMDAQKCQPSAGTSSLTRGF